MIPESGSTKAFKRALLRTCSIWPDIGEVYAFTEPRFSIVDDSKYWVVHGVSRYVIETYLLGTGGCTCETIPVEYWFEMIERSELKFVRYAP
jgi:hypothetical protein